MSDLVVASNRGPVTYALDAQGCPVARRAGGGLAPSLVSALAGTGAAWVATAMSDADRLAAPAGSIAIDGITVKLLDIPGELRRDAYNVIANGTLWFLHHGLFDKARQPAFDLRWFEAWRAYLDYNRRYAEAIAALASPGATVLVQDYHLALCGAALAELRPDLRTAHFTHTPFCDPAELAVLPDKVALELITGMASFGACGFHTDRWADAFAACTRHVLGIEAHRFVARLSPDTRGIAEVASSPECRSKLDLLERRLAGRKLLLRSDRIELSKNLVRGFLAFDEMLQRLPSLRGNVVFLALAYGSREDLPEYAAYRADVHDVANEVNKRWSTPTWEPVVLDVADDFVASVAALERYDVLLVNPIRDGLNLVAMEGPAVNRRDGLLVLSREAGACDALGGAALTVHPFDVSGTADALGRALSMESRERKDRSARLRQLAGGREPSTWLAELRAAARPARSG